MRSTTILSILLLAIITTACGSDPACHETGCHTDDDVVDVDAAPGTPDAAPQVVTETLTLVPGQILEGIYTAGVGDTMQLQATTAAGTFDWNIHGHAGGSTQIVAEDFAVATVDYLFAPTATAEWFLLLRNSGAVDVTLDITLTSVGGAWSGWEQ